jgi:hypothetical protein
MEKLQEIIYLFDKKNLKTLCNLYKLQAYNEYSLFIVFIVTILCGFHKWSIISFACSIFAYYYIHKKIIDEKKASIKIFADFVSRFKEITTKNNL